MKTGGLATDQGLVQGIGTGENILLGNVMMTGGSGEDLIPILGLVLVLHVPGIVGGGGDGTRKGHLNR